MGKFLLIGWSFGVVVMAETIVYSIRLMEGEAKAWKAFCDERQVRPRAHAATVLCAEMRKAARENEPAKRVQLEADPVKTRRRLTLTESEFQAVNRLAELNGMSFQSFMISALRGIATQTPQFSGEETKALWESNYQLRAIGRNLNQLAKRVNELQNDLSSEQANKILDFVRQLDRFITNHAKVVNRLTANNLQRWKIK